MFGRVGTSENTNVGERTARRSRLRPMRNSVGVRHHGAPIKNHKLYEYYLLV